MGEAPGDRVGVNAGRVFGVGEELVAARRVSSEQLVDALVVAELLEAQAKSLANQGSAGDVTIVIPPILGDEE